MKVTETLAKQLAAMESSPFDETTIPTLSALPESTLKDLIQKYTPVSTPSTEPAVQQTPAVTPNAVAATAATSDNWLASAPPEVQQALTHLLAQHSQSRNRIIRALVAAGKGLTEDDLKDLSEPVLAKIAKSYGMNLTGGFIDPIDFSGRAAALTPDKDIELPDTWGLSAASVIDN